MDKNYSKKIVRPQKKRWEGKKQVRLHLLGTLNLILFSNATENCLVCVQLNVKALRLHLLTTRPHLTKKSFL